MKSANWILAAVFSGLCQVGQVAAQATAQPDCEAIAARLGAQAGLPDGLLPAISRIESGRPGKGGTRAWPWTLNTGGQGHYFENNYDALDFVEKFISKGQRNVDLGCMQINYRWHGENFASIAAMMDPVQNITYSIKFLKTLREQSGSWSAAVQRYHSNDPDRGVAYHAKFLAALDRVQDGVGGVGGRVADNNRTHPKVANTVGGLFASYGVSEGALVPRVRPPGNSEEIDAYAHLIAVLAVADAEMPQTSAAPVVLVKRLEGGELGRRWQDVESFRLFFQDQPEG